MIIDLYLRSIVYVMLGLTIMAAILRDVVIGSLGARARPRSMPLVTLTLRNELHGFLFL